MKLTKLLQRVCSLAVVASVVLLGVSCSQDDSLQASTDNLQNKEIKFNASTSEPETRATPITSQNYLEEMPDFSVWAYYMSDNSYYIGDKSGTGTIVTNNKGIWTPSETSYWPDGKALNFYAISPSIDNKDYYSNSDGTIDYTVPTDISKQVDVMYAQKTRQSLETNNGTVNFRFNHALSQVQVNFINPSKEVTAEIQSVSLINLFSHATIDLVNGTVTQNQSEIRPGQPGQLVSPGLNYSMNFNTPLSVLPSKQKNATAGDKNNIFLLAPQTTVDMQSSGIGLKPEGQTAISITYRLKKNNTYIKGSASSFVTEQTGSSFDFTAGGSYIINIKTGTEISYTVSVTDWQNGKDYIGPRSHRAVDLGLPSGTKWANINLGEEYVGDVEKYAFGDVNSYNHGYYMDSWDPGYVWGADSLHLTKYCLDDKHGSVDNKNELDLSDDAAYTRWGKDWRIPSLDDWLELIHNCTWEYTTIYGKKGYKVTGPNGNYIFLPSYGNTYTRGKDINSVNLEGIGTGSELSYATRKLTTNTAYMSLFIWYGHTLREWYKGNSLDNICRKYNLDPDGIFVPQNVRRDMPASVRPVSYK